MFHAELFIKLWEMFLKLQKRATEKKTLYRNILFSFKITQSLSLTKLAQLGKFQGFLKICVENWKQLEEVKYV